MVRGNGLSSLKANATSNQSWHSILCFVFSQRKCCHQRVESGGWWESEVAELESCRLELQAGKVRAVLFEKGDA